MIIKYCIHRLNYSSTSNTVILILEDDTHIIVSDDFEDSNLIRVTVVGGEYSEFLTNNLWILLHRIYNLVNGKTYWSEL